MSTRAALTFILLALPCVSAPLPTLATGKIKHVVILFQENRTPDNLFHGLPNADIANSGVNSKGQIIKLEPVPLATEYDQYHYHRSFLAMYDGGKMDGADLVGSKCGHRNPDCVIPPNPQFKYVNPADVAPYFTLAQRYTFADRMFQTNQGDSYPAHQFIISGTSAPSPYSDLFVMEGPRGPDRVWNTGCTAPAEQYVKLIDPTGDDSQRMYPCFEHPTLIDLLDSRNISWRYYTWGSGSIWTGPNSILHLRSGPAWSHVIADPTQVLRDIAAGHLKKVSWVIPDGFHSDHSGGGDGSGPSWVASVVNAIGNSPYWANTAILITWDDWGGWYDHVAPRVINSYEYGFRVPLIVVSPYAKQGYVSHVTHDFGSILKFIETVFGLPSLGYADAQADDLSDCFSFSQSPAPFQTIHAPLNADYFLNDTTPGEPPDDD